MAGPNRAPTPGRGPGPGGPGARGGFQKPKNVGKTIARLAGYVTRSKSLLLFVLFCIPIITIGPAFAAMTKIARYYVEEKPVFLFSDFWDAFKENFRQGLVFGIVHIGLIYVFFQVFIYYYVQTLTNPLFWILVGILIVIMFLVLFSSYYVYTMMVSVNLTIWQIVKNSFMFIFIGIRTNMLTFFFATMIYILSFVFIPFSLPVIALLTFSMSTLITVFNSRPYVYEYLMKPYYEMSGIENPYERKVEEEEDEPVFEDNI